MTINKRGKIEGWRPQTYCPALNSGQMTAPVSITDSTPVPVIHRSRNTKSVPTSPAQKPVASQISPWTPKTFPAKPNSTYHASPGDLTPLSGQYGSAGSSPGWKLADNGSLSSFSERLRDCLFLHHFLRKTARMIARIIAAITIHDASQLSWMKADLALSATAGACSRPGLCGSKDET